MLANSGNEKNILNKWESFTAKFRPGTVITMPDLRMTDQEGFCLKDLSDLENSQSMLIHVKSLNISNNLISKLRLRNFLSIETLDASRNMIGEVFLSLKSLQNLNLSYNLISKIFELKDLPNLVSLNLSYNIIEKISIKDFLDVKKTLRNLNLSYNKINLEAHDFISFIEGLKNFNLKTLGIKENSFLAKSASLKNIYKLYISLCIPCLDEIDNEKIKLDPSIGKLNDLTNQILMDAADLQRNEIRKKLKNNTELFKAEQNNQLLNDECPNTAKDANNSNNKSQRLPTVNSLASQENKGNSDNNNNKLNTANNLEAGEHNVDNTHISNKHPIKQEILFLNISHLINRIIKNLDNIYISKYDFQSLYLEILDDLMLLVSGKYKNFAESNKEELHGSFAILLTKLHCFMENADETEESTILEIIANLAFIEKGDLSKMIFDFLKSIIISSHNKVNKIGRIVKKAITDNLNEIINKWSGEFTILEHITDFFDDSFPINLDDVFQENIIQFLEMFKSIWGIKSDRHSNFIFKDKNLNNLNAIEEAQDEQSSFDDNNEQDELSIAYKFQLKKTSIVILSKYLEYQVDAMKKQKKQKQLDEKANFERIEDKVEKIKDDPIKEDYLFENNEIDCNQSNNTYLSFESKDYNQNDSFDVYKGREEKRVDNRNNNVYHNKKNEEDNFINNVNDNLKNFDYSKEHSNQINPNKTFDQSIQNMRKDEEFNASIISNKDSKKASNQTINQNINLDLTDKILKNSQNNLQTKNINNTSINNQTENKSNYENDTNRVNILSESYKKLTILEENQNSPYLNQTRSLEEVKANKSNLNKSSGENKINEEIEILKDSIFKQEKNNVNNNSSKNKSKINNIENLDINSKSSRSRRSSEKNHLLLQQKENNQSIKFQNQELVNQSLNSGRGLIVAEKDYSKVKEKLENSILINNDINKNNSSLISNKDNYQDRNNLSVKSVKPSNKGIVKELDEKSISINKNIKESKDKTLINNSNKNIENISLLSKKSHSKQFYENNILNLTEEQDEKDILDNTQHLENMSPSRNKSNDSLNNIHFKKDNLNGKKVFLNDLDDISKISKKSKVLNNTDNNLSKNSIDNFNLNKSKENLSNENLNSSKEPIKLNLNNKFNKYNNIVEEEQNNNSNNDISLKIKLNKSLENKNIENNLLNLENNKIAYKSRKSFDANTNTETNYNNKNNRTNLKKNNDQNKNSEIKKHLIFLNDKTSIANKKTFFKKTIKNKTSKLDLASFADFYLKVRTKIESDFKSLNDIKTKEELEIFKAFLDFNSLLFQQIKRLDKENLIVKSDKQSNEFNYIFKSDDFGNYLLNLVEQIFKRYRIEESDRKDNEFDIKFASYFPDYLEFKKNSNSKSGLQASNVNSNNADNSAALAVVNTGRNGNKTNRTAEINKIDTYIKNNNINKNRGNMNQNQLNNFNKISLFEELCELKELIISIIKCLASSYRLCEPGRLQQNFELDIIKKIIGISKKSVQIDPFMMEASLSFIFILLGDEKTKSDYTVFYNLINKFENYSNFKNLLDLINVNSKKYQDFINYIYSKISKTKVLITDYNLDKIEGARKYVKRVIQSIIFIFKRLSRYVLVPSSTILHTAKELGSTLRNNNQFQHLSNCLKINEDAIRLNAIKTIFYSESDKIELHIMDDIMKTISEYSSITEGETEIILSIVYLLFNKIMHTQISKAELLNQVSILNALQKSFEFLEKNLERKAPNSDELVQKNELSLSLLLYISTLSKYQIGKEQLQKFVQNHNNYERFHKILEYDFLIYEKKFYFPIEIERTILGAKVKSYFEITKRISNPYSISFLRVLMKIADILCDIPDYSLPFLMDLKSNKIITALNSHINKRFLFRIYNESLAWNDFVGNLDKFVQDYANIKDFINEKEKKNKRLMIEDEEELKVFKLNVKNIRSMNDSIIKSGKKETNKIDKIHELLLIDTKYLQEKNRKNFNFKNRKNNNFSQQINFYKLNGNNKKDSMKESVYNKNNSANPTINNTFNDFNNNSNFNNNEISILKDKSYIFSQLENYEDNLNFANDNNNNEYNNFEAIHENIDFKNYDEFNNNDQDKDNNAVRYSDQKETRKNLIMDYYAIVLAKVEKKQNKRNESSNLLKSKNQIKASVHVKQDQRKYANLYEQIDFIVFFPNLMNYIIGKSPNLSDKTINQDLYAKYDIELIKAINQFQSFKSEKDLNSFVMINNSNVMQDANLKSHIKDHYLDDAEKQFYENFISKKEEKNKIFGSNKFTDSKKSSSNNKNACNYENYKEYFFRNSINFNKKTYAQSFSTNTKSSIYWKNEIPMKFDWKIIENIHRLPEAESQNNSNTRSLLVASLLRCVYPVLKSYSENIRKKFIEILFSQNIYYEFFLFVSSGLYLKFNIGQKLLNIFSLLYGINFQHIKGHFKSLYPESVAKPQKNLNDLISHNNFADKNNNNSHNINANDNNSNNYFKEINKPIKEESLPDHVFKYYSKLLEIISITTIFIKKIYSITFIEKNMHYKSNNNFLNVFISCLNQILNSITNCIFPECFKESIENLVINNLLKNNFIKNILLFISFITHLNEKVSKILYKKILLKNFYANNLKSKTNKALDEDIIDYLLYFKFVLEKSKRTFINTIALLKILCKENKNIFLKEILYFEIKDYQKQIKHKSFKFKTKNKENENDKMNNFNFNYEFNNSYQEKEKKNNKRMLHENTNIVKLLKQTKNNKNTPEAETPSENIENKQKEKLENSRKFKEHFVKEIFDDHKLTKLAIDLQKGYFRDELRIASYKCELEIINEYRKSFNILILTNLNIYLFELDVIAYENNFELKLLEDSKFFKIEIEKLLDLFYFDYNTRLIFEYKKPQNTSIDSLLNKIQQRVKSPKENNNNDSKINITNSDQLTNAHKFDGLHIEEASNTTQSNSLINTGNELNKEIDELNSTRINSSILNENRALDSNNDNNNNNQSIFSGLFGKVNFLGGLLSASSTPEEKDVSLFFSICFRSLFETANLFQSIQDANRKLKTKPDSAMTNYTMLEYFMNRCEKAKPEKLISKPKNNNAHKQENQNEENLKYKDSEQEQDIPIFLNDSFKKEEFEFLKNEYKIKNSFGIYENEHVSIMLKKIKAFIVNFDTNQVSFNFFGNLNNENKSVFNKNRKILFFGKESIYFIEENFALLNVEFFDNQYLYKQNLDKNACFAISLEINFSVIKDIEIIDNQCFIDYSDRNDQKKLKFEVIKREENEFIYFYLMKNLVKNITNNDK